jgi:hypothetical protein
MDSNQSALLESFEKNGLPKDYSYPTLAYHQPTASIIAQIRPVKSQLPGYRLFFRRTDETRYHPIGDFSPPITINSFAIHASLPLVYFVTYVWAEHTFGTVGGYGGYWDALHCFNLKTFQIKVVAQAGELIAPDSYESARLCDLFSLSDDGGTLYCKASFQTREEPIPHCHHCLAQLSLADLKLEIVTKLEAHSA